MGTDLFARLAQSIERIEHPKKQTKNNRRVFHLTKVTKFSRFKNEKGHSKWSGLFRNAFEQLHAQLVSDIAEFQIFFRFSTQARILS